MSASAPPPSALRSPLALRAALVAFYALGALAILELRLASRVHVLQVRRPTDEATIPSATAIRALSLGHREWAADLLWSAALVYYGETLATRQQQRFLQRYADTIEDVDPNFREAYRWGAMVSIYNARIIRREGVENAIRHLERGLRVFPDDGEMTHQLGFNYYFELTRVLPEGPERAAARRRGAEYLRRAAALGYGPQWMAFAAVDALERAGLADRAIAQLRDMYLRAEDPAVRDHIATRIRAIARERGEDPFLVEVQRMEAERRASFPYMAPLQYLFVGPPVPGIARTPRR